LIWNFWNCLKCQSTEKLLKSLDWSQLRA